MTGNETVLVVNGAMIMGCAVAALFFGRFWKESRDRLFGFFCAAFALLGVQRLLAVMLPDSPVIYIVRLIAFTMILVAIADKNRAANE